MSFFQLKDTAECRNLMFLSFDHLSRLGVPVGGSHYNKVYSGTLKSGENLDSIYERKRTPAKENTEKLRRSFPQCQ